MNILALDLIGVLLFVLTVYYTLGYLGRKLKEQHRQRQLKKSLTISKFVRISGGGYVQFFKYNRIARSVEPC